jgi:hypothetical protein
MKDKYILAIILTVVVLFVDFFVSTDKAILMCLTFILAQIIANGASNDKP